MVVHMADDYSKSQMIGLGITFIFLPIIAVGLRLWAKYLGHRSIHLDDYLILVALTFAIGCCSIQLVAATKGALGQHEEDDAEGNPILGAPKFIIYEKCKFAVNMISTIGLGVTKSSILVFYMSIFRGDYFRYAAQTMLGITITWTVSFFFSNLFTCYPITPFVEPFYGHKCVAALTMWYAMSISDIIVDIMILTLPIPMVLRLQLRQRQKVGILMMFLLGAIVCAFSVTRSLAYYHVGEVLSIHFADETYYTSPVFFWANIELSSAIISACLPTYRPIWLYYKKKDQHSTARSSEHIPSYPAKRIPKRWGYSQRLGVGADFADDMELTVATVNTHIDGGHGNPSDPLPAEGGIGVEYKVDMSYH